MRCRQNAQFLQTAAQNRAAEWVSVLKGAAWRVLLGLIERTNNVDRNEGPQGSFCSCPASSEPCGCHPPVKASLSCLPELSVRCTKTVRIEHLETEELFLQIGSTRVCCLSQDLHKDLSQGLSLCTVPLVTVTSKTIATWPWVPSHIHFSCNSTGRCLSTCSCR